MIISRKFLTPLIAAGALALSAGEAAAQVPVCPAGDFSWDSVEPACRDQDKLWGFINNNLDPAWNADADAIDVTIGAVGTFDTHFIEFKELEDFAVTGSSIVGSISVVDDPTTPENERDLFFIDLVDLDTTVGVGQSGLVDVIVTKEIFSDAALSNLLVTLTSIDGAFVNAPLPGGPLQDLFFRDTITINDGVLFTIENSFRQVLVPEPGSLGLLAISVLGLGAAARRRSGASKG